MAGSEQALERFFSIVIEEGLRPTRANLEFDLDRLFGDVDFRGRRVLEIGAGRGLYSFYAACSGAEEVIALEPEAEGSTSGVGRVFDRVQERLGCGHVRLKLRTFQEFDPAGTTFDVILLYNSINHLDESACVRLLGDPAAQDVYQALFKRLAGMAEPGARLIICDCSRYNLFARLGLRNPLAPSIEWHKHQAPELWIDMLSKAGFVRPEVTWSTFKSLRRAGRVLLGNRFAAYCLQSHFCLKMDYEGADKKDKHFV